jgi:Domain of unknown function (DUF5666)
MNQLTAALIVVIGILGGFYVGAKYGQGHPTSSASSTGSSTGTGAGAFAGAGGGGGGGGGNGGGGAGGGAFAGAGGNATFGTITAVNGDTITVHNPRTNADVKVNVSSARITKTADGSPADLTQNQTVTIVGQTGSDGVVTATTIALGTTGFGGRGAGGGAAPSPSPSTGT